MLQKIPIAVLMRVSGRSRSMLAASDGWAESATKKESATSKVNPSPTWGELSVTQGVECNRFCYNKGPRNAGKSQSTIYVPRQNVVR